MNYIAQLQHDVAEAQARITAIREQIAAMRAHLASPKFVGVESDGSRRDWIATGDMHTWLASLDEVAR